MNRPFFSIISPCWNCSKTIERLLDSVLAQGLDKSEYEVILSNDGNADNWTDKVKKYEDKINIKCINTKNPNSYKPGVTRTYGLSIATGEWIVFIDNDDMFYPQSLKAIKDYIIETNEQLCVATSFGEYFLETDEINIIDIGNITWLHGKVYNKDNLIDKYNIHFPAFKTHEDLFWNTQVLCVLKENGFEFFNYYPLLSYKWVARPDSITRQYFSKLSEENFLEENFEDYLEAAGRAYLERLDRNNEIFDFLFNQVCMALLHIYFYYEAEVYRLGREKSEHNLITIKNWLYEVLEKGFTKEEIIKHVLSDGYKYCLVREDIPRTSGFFIEKDTFEDFINLL